MSTIINPATGKAFTPAPHELFIEVEAVKVYNAGSQYSSDQVVFKCPYCQSRNKQNIRLALALAQKNVAGFRCNHCRKLVYVRKPRNKESRIESPYTH